MTMIEQLAAYANVAREIYIDFETYYDDAMTLRKMSTSEYVAALIAPGIENTVHCVGVGMVGMQGTRVLSAEEFQALAGEIQWARIIVSGWNLQFDGLILSLGYGVSPAAWCDGMGVSRATLGSSVKSHSLSAIGEHCGFGGKDFGGAALSAIKGKLRCEMTPSEYESLAHYCAKDVELTARIMRAQPVLSADEYTVLDWTIRNYVEPPSLRLNPLAMQTALAADTVRREMLLRASGFDQKTLNSNEKLAGALADLGVMPPTKVSKTTGKETFAFSKSDQEFTDLVEDEDPRVRALVEARLGTKTSIVGTRVKTFQRHAEANDHWLRPALQYGAAHTGRFGGGGAGEKQNLQNLPPDLKSCIVAPAGYKIGNVDAAQIELRITLMLAGQKDILVMLDQGIDVYAWFASKVYNREIVKGVDLKERQVGKVAVLSLQYGAGWKTFQAMVRVMTAKAGATVLLNEAEAKLVVTTYRRVFYRVTQLWQHLNGCIASMAAGNGRACALPTIDCVYFDNDSILLPSGLKLLYPDMTRTPEHEKKPGPSFDEYTYRSHQKAYAKDSNPRKKVFGGLLLENISQALARTHLADVQVRAMAVDIVIVLQVHDSLIFVAEEEAAEQTLITLKSIMSTSPRWWPDLKLSATGNIGNNYKEACEDA
jgi:hypothetical protein